MRVTTRFFVLGALIAFGAANAALALAADKEQVIKDRQALMKGQGADLGAIKGFLEDKADLAKATAAATDLPAKIRKIADVFPPGTEGPDPEGKYGPKPEVWSDWKGFLAAQETAVAKADALLAAVKGGDKAAIQTAFADMGKNGCGACHGKYREELKK